MTAILLLEAIAKIRGKLIAITIQKPEGAKTIVIPVVERAITIARAIKIRSKELMPKIKQRRIIAITVHETIEKSSITYQNI